VHFCFMINEENCQNLTLFKLEERRYLPNYWSNQGNRAKHVKLQHLL